MKGGIVDKQEESMVGMVARYRYLGGGYPIQAYK